MAVYDVDLPNGKTIQVQGPDDATDDELIAIARTHPSLGKQSAKPSAKTEAQPSGTGMTAGQLPAMSNPEQLLQEAKASTPGLKAAIPGAFTATQGTPAMPTAGGLYDLVSQGDIKGAWNALPESVRDVTQYGAPAAAGALALKQAYNLYQSKKEGEAPTGIKARTIGGNAPAPAEAAPIPSVAATPTEPAFNPKEAKIAKEIENKFGYSWKDIKSNFGVSDVSITSPQEAEMLAGAYHQKQQAPTVEATPVTPAAEVITPVETTKAPAPPPEVAAKTGISPEIMEAKLGKPTLTTGSGMPAYEGQGTELKRPKHKQGDIASLKEVPNNMVFVPGGQSMDIVRNAVGQPEYTKNLKSSGGYPSSPQAAYKQSVEINKSLGRPSYSEAKAAGVHPEPTPSITQKIGGSKTVRVGGVTGALILATDLASAAQEGAAAAKQGDRQMATGYLTDIIGALSGPIGFTASQILGTSPEELKTLREAEQRRKVGAGRGIAPPSAYQR